MLVAMPTHSRSQPVTRPNSVASFTGMAGSGAALMFDLTDLCKDLINLNRHKLWRSHTLCPCSSPGLYTTQEAGHSIDLV
jgi:hypothetical protein